VREELLGFSLADGERGREAGDARRAEGLYGGPKTLEILLRGTEEGDHRALSSVA
jgi:hypothetical protein